MTGGNRLFSSYAYQNKFIEIWEDIATRYKDNTTIWGYDLLNEPMEGTALIATGWIELATKVGKAIRLIDTQHAIIVEPDAALGFNYLTPLSGVSGVVYSPHIYTTLAYTHQGVLTGYPEGVALPSLATLTASLQSARDFQTDYNVHIYVGEFSAVRWAPNAATWFTNMTDLFESYGWDWSYHAFREWDGWDLERPSSHAMTPYPSNTDRLIAIKTKLIASNN